ncbi:MAG: aminotransferase class I/II-fold pyridoxal phosphate-dependent enzyme [Planctomycetota bacterium]|jgi:8-amino-7-oxononanoate synthase|nr:aminotransferase class I/II-fold pyridoxal phosphate-dependent enzyme [Planctomycetota bacterium]MDA1202574.1 aminotransferase class I/II-fold pyridoxal phosphate-dependent enzyme [Planctomycetota bacterium]
MISTTNSRLGRHAAATTSGVSGSTEEVDPRARPGAHTREAITPVVIRELERSLPPDSRRPLSVRSSLMAAGIDAARLGDAITRIEGRYGMRFHEEWLIDVQTCGDLVQCVAERMFDAADRAPPRVTPQPQNGPAPAQPGQDDDFPECRVIEERLATLEQVGLANPFLLAHEAVAGRSARIAGREIVSFTSFDYLGLAGHPDVTAAAKAAIDRFGCSSSASRLVGGNTTLLDALDAELAAFLGAEGVAVFPCGYGTNASVLSHLFGDGDLILYDELSHNSMTQGVTASGAAARSFRHNDADSLDGLLRDLRGRYRRVVVAIEGVYSMDGDYPDLPRFIDIKQRHEALLYVDEAHSLGTMGPTGRGICEHFGVSPAAGDLWMGTISKSLGSGGGYIAGSRRLVDYLRLTTPALVFSTASSPANSAAALEAVRVLQREAWRVERLRERAELFLKLAIDAGLDTGTSDNTPVIPVILGSSERALAVSQHLLERGINARPILYPAVRESAARVRFFITAEHTEDQIVRAVEEVAAAAAR